MTTDASRAESDQKPGELFIVATPIGNLDDISRRALDTLQSVGLILSEDTRRTRTLLQHYGIATGCESYHDHNERQKTPKLVERLLAGESFALVTDAGTPLISDPGYRLVSACAECGVTVVPIPGASAVTALLSVSGLPTDRFFFEGYLPPKGAKRNRRLRALTDLSHTIVLFESPHRLARTLKDLNETLGDRRACLGRELTKKFEEIRHSTLCELLNWCGERTVRGEITLVVAGAPDE